MIKEERIKKAKVHVKTTWEGGVKTTSLMRGFEIVADAPKWKYGTNSAPAPGEIFLASIGACFTSTFTKCAQDVGAILYDVFLDIKANITQEINGKERITNIEYELKAYSEEKFKKKLQNCYETAKDICPLLNVINCEVKTNYIFEKG